MNIVYLKLKNQFTLCEEKWDSIPIVYYKLKNNNKLTSSCCLAFSDGWVGIFKVWLQEKMHKPKQTNVVIQIYPCR